MTKPQRTITMMGALAGIFWLWRSLFFDENLHSVIPGAIYRSGQPSPESLLKSTEAMKLRSVLSLRGAGSTDLSDPVIRTIIEEHGVEYRVLRLSRSMPSTRDLNALVQAMDTAPRPMLLHCRQGVERSGLASAVALLLADRPLLEARKQLRLRFGYTQVFSRSDLPRVLDQYASWLAEHGIHHSAEAFRGWAKNDYTPYFYRAKIEPLDLPDFLSTGIDLELSFRVTNISPEAWTFGTEKNRRVRLDGELNLIDPNRYQLYNAAAVESERVLKPGESTVLTLRFPPLAKHGLHQLTVDLSDRHRRPFSKFGSSEFKVEIDVRLPTVSSDGSATELGERRNPVSPARSLAASEPRNVQIQGE